MCGLDATEKCALTASQIEKMCQSNNRIARFCGDMAGYSLANGNKYRGNVSIHDAVPFMYLTHPELFVAKKAVLDVECSDCASRGRTICDFRWWQHEESEENVVLMDADGARFQEYLIEGSAGWNPFSAGCTGISGVVRTGLVFLYLGKSGCDGTSEKYEIL